MTVYLARHGQIVQQTPRRFVGQSDKPLDATGEKQAELLAHTLREAPIARILTSPLPRCLHTALPVSRERDIPVLPVEALREINLGDWQGLTREEVEARFPGGLAARLADHGGYRPAGGESFEDLLARVRPVADEVLAGNEPVLIVGHSGVNRAILCRVLGLPLHSVLNLGQDYGCLNIVERRGTGLLVRCLNLPPGAPLPPPSA